MKGQHIFPGGRAAARIASFFEALEDAGGLPDLDKVAVGVADVATDLRSPVDRWG